jgi:hypothetical protein
MKTTTNARLMLTFAGLGIFDHAELVECDRANGVLTVRARDLEAIEPALEAAERIEAELGWTVAVR